MSTLTTTEKSLATSWQLCFMLALAAAMILLPSLLFAADTGRDTPIGNIFCTVSGWFTGNTGKGIATIAVTIIGIGALLGKVSWGMALIVGLGVAIVFGAGSILNALNIDGMDEGCNTNASWDNELPQSGTP